MKGRAALARPFSCTEPIPRGGRGALPAQCLDAAAPPRVPDVHQVERRERSRYLPADMTRAVLRWEL